MTADIDRTIRRILAAEDEEAVRAAVRDGLEELSKNSCDRARARLELRIHLVGTEPEDEAVLGRRRPPPMDAETEWKYQLAYLELLRQT